MTSMPSSQRAIPARPAPRVRRFVCATLIAAATACCLLAAEPQSPMEITSPMIRQLKWRAVGPANMGGRVSSIAVDPKKPYTIFVGLGTGGVMKSTDNGVSWQGVFEHESVASVGAIAVAPSDPNVVWVGTGEANSRNSSSWGDGVYQSTDGGATWTNKGLKDTQTISRIVVDPADPRVAYVAALGHLWGANKERGVFKTTDGGGTWTPVLQLGDTVGCVDLVMDPSASSVLYAAMYHRLRTPWSFVSGGTQGGIYKTTDGGRSWHQLTNGLPAQTGRIGLDIYRANPKILYAVVESDLGGQSAIFDDKSHSGGVFRTGDGGSTWNRVSQLAPRSFYFSQIRVDPADEKRVYVLGFLVHVSDDGGATFRDDGAKGVHVDHHAMWIDPSNTDHILLGNDGGFYASYSRSRTWDFFNNMAIGEFYRITADLSRPYRIAGGLQDNNNWIGPSATRAKDGITNADWLPLGGGDGFYNVIDAKDPNIVYAESQYGGLGRYDRKSGEQIYIQPQPGRGEPALRWNWDAPLIISPHSHTRLYFAANKLFRSDDRGNTWRAVSPDLTRQIDRRKLKVMGKVWSADTVAYNASTSFYGNIVALNESPVKEGLLYVGTDDGLLQISEDGGGNWRKTDKFPGIPENTYVSDVESSPLDADTVFVAFDNHKMGDFKPYLLKSTDRGKTWSSIAGDLPERGSALTVAQDFVNPSLLFAGTEFGLYFTIDGGKKWIQLSSLPLIAVRDIALHRRENDLAVATFGRGFYILDDYTPLRTLKPEMLEQDAALYPVKQAAMYIEASPLGGRDRSFQGSSFYVAPNPPFGAVFTYYLKEDLKSRKEQRHEQEKKLQKEGSELVFPSWETLRTEEREQEPSIILTVTDEEGNVVRRLTAPAKAGFHRVSWDLHFPPSTPTRLQEPERGFFGGPPQGPLAAPGTYKVAMAKEVDGVVTPLGEAQTLAAVPLGLASLPAQDQAAQLAFQRKTAHLQRAVRGAVQAVNEAQERLKYVQKAILDTPKADLKLAEQARTLQLHLEDIAEKLSGDPVLAEHNEPTPPAIVDRVEGIVGGHWASSSEATRTFQDDYAIAAAEFAPVLTDLRQTIGVDMKNLEDQLEALGAPWTPGRLPTWTPE